MIYLLTCTFQREIIQKFVEKIVLHKRSEPHKKNHYTHQIDVYFIFEAREKPPDFKILQHISKTENIFIGWEHLQLPFCLLYQNGSEIICTVLPIPLSYVESKAILSFAVTEI